MSIAKKAKLILAVCTAFTGMAGAAVVEKPSVMPDTMGCVVVSDLHGFIDGAGSVAAQVNPMMSGTPKTANKKERDHSAIVRQGV